MDVEISNETSVPTNLKGVMSKTKSVFIITDVGA